MSDDPSKQAEPDDDDNDSDTWPVPPPGFHERLLAAQKARSSGIRASVEIPIVVPKPSEPTAPADQSAE